MKIVVRQDFEGMPDDGLLELFCLLKKPKDTLLITKHQAGVDNDESAAVPPSPGHGTAGMAASCRASSCDTSCSTAAAEKSAASPALRDLEVVVDIKRTSRGELAFKIEALDVLFYVPPEQGAARLNEVIAGILGYRQATLRGLCVKDSDGNRIKPLISLYIEGDAGLVAPSAFEYTKEAPQRADSALEMRAATLSPIITSLLEKAPLSFRASAVLLTLVGNGEICARLGVPAIMPAADVLMGFSADGRIRHVLNSAHTYFSKQLKCVLLHGCSDADVAAFFKKISGGLKESDYEYLVDVVETFPKTYDTRDCFISSLQNYLYMAAPHSPGVMCDYLEVKKMRPIRGNIRSSLRKFSK